MQFSKMIKRETLIGTYGKIALFPNNIHACLSFSA